MRTDEKCQDYQVYIFKVIDYLTYSYHEMFGNWLNRIDITDIVINKDLYNKMIFVTLEYKDEESYRNSFDEICNCTSSNFIRDLDGQENMAKIKGCFYTKLEDSEISLFFMRCLWIYHRFPDWEWKEWFVTYHIVIPFVYYSNVDITEKEKEAYANVLQLLDENTNAQSLSKTEIQAICLKIEETVEKLQKRREDILRPVTEQSSYYKKKWFKLMHDYFRQRFYLYWNQLNLRTKEWSDEDG